MFLDREKQRALLIDLRRHYPGFASRAEFIPNWVTDDGVDQGYAKNLHYLEEHDLVELKTHTSLDSRNAVPKIVQARITSKGLDFLEDDGGLSAILGTVTVRLHADTIRDLIETKIAESEDVPEEDKPGLIAALKEMREEGLKQLTQRVVSHGLDQAPGAWSAIINALT
ncbi:hypothetical protein [Halomonas cerina]|uniref:Uncharacterized protein n=1 Tax=Halomonas cerina TaxID=447424 RepID=A0A839VD68_9GAMM|nr:hypothetical protein [Halomonas cerina]MBB3192068.1 hypothetical protein [Halomonas cerina]